MIRKMGTVAGLLMASVQVNADHAGFQVEGGAGAAVNTIGAELLAPRQQVLALQYQLLDLDELSDEELLESEEALHSVNEFSQASVAYSVGVSDRLTISAVLPYVSRADFREAEHHHDDEGEAASEHEEAESGEHGEEPLADGDVLNSDLEGWGDLSLLGRYALTGVESEHRFALLAGMKTPTGETGETLDNGEKAEVEHQPGSGSWDPLLGLAYSSRAGERWGFSGNVLYQLTTEGKRDTELGDSLLYNAAVVWSPGIHTHHNHSHGSHVDQSWQMALELNGEWRDKTEVDGHRDSNSGGNLVFATAGIRWTVASWSLQMALELPVHENLNGTQSEPDWRVRSGVSISF